MTQSIIGSNAALRYLKAYDAHVSYWHEINPAYQVAYVDKPEHVPYIREYAAALPQSMIVARIYHPLDGGFHLAPTGAGDTRHYVSSPAEYLNAYGDLGKMSNIILNIMNEPNANGSPDEMLRLVEWFIGYIPLAASIGCKSVLFNWADRNPQIINGMMDSQFDDVLKMMAVHPELFYMGMHFYGPDEIISHLESYIKRCELLKIKPPKVIGTEFGLDSTGGTERGYKSRANYKDIYAQWQETVVKGALKPYIDSGVLAGLCVFQEGNSGGFDDFDFENDSAYKSEIKRAALAGEISVPTSDPPAPPPVITPPYTPDPFTPNMKYVINTPADYVNMRLSPNGLEIGRVPNKSVIVVTEEQLVSGEYWRKVTYGDVTGWISMQKGAVKLAPYIPDSPSTVNIPIDLLKNIQSSLKNNISNLSRDLEMVNQILEKVGGSV